MHPPPDPATFQINRTTNHSIISKDEREKVDKLLKIPSLFDQSMLLRNKEMEKVPPPSRRSTR